MDSLRIRDPLVATHCSSGGKQMDKSKPIQMCIFEHRGHSNVIRPRSDTRVGSFSDIDRLTQVSGQAEKSESTATYSPLSRSQQSAAMSYSCCKWTTAEKPLRAKQLMFIRNRYWTHNACRALVVYKLVAKTPRWLKNGEIQV